MVDTVLRHQREAEAACDQRQRPIVARTVERDFAVDPLLPEELSGQLVVFTSRAPNLWDAGEISKAYRWLASQTVIARHRNHHPFAK